MEKKNYQKWIIRYIIGIILLSIVGVASYFIAYDYARKYYYDQLENLIVDRYLEGNNAIGAYSYNIDKETTLNPPGKYTNDTYLLLTDSSYKKIPNGGYINMFPEGTFNNIHIINTLSDEDKYKWWAATDFLNCMIIKKTEEGFDFINEGMIGIGFNLLWFPTAVETSKDFFGREEYHLKDFSLCEQYVNELLSDKYRDIIFKHESDNRKYNLLQELRMKYAAVGGSLYFGNLFFELRPNKYYEYIGDHTMYQRISTFGNDYNTLFVTTVTAHYSIQECGDELKAHIQKYVTLALVFVLLVFSGYCLFKFKMSGKNSINN